MAEDIGQAPLTQLGPDLVYRDLRGTDYGGEGQPPVSDMDPWTGRPWVTGPGYDSPDYQASVDAAMLAASRASQAPGAAEWWAERDAGLSGRMGQSAREGVVGTDPRTRDVPEAPLTARDPGDMVLMDTGQEVISVHPATSEPVGGRYDDSPVGYTGIDYGDNQVVPQEETAASEPVTGAQALAAPAATGGVSSLQWWMLGGGALVLAYLWLRKRGGSK